MTNKPKIKPVLMLLILMPVILPAYFLGVLISLVYVSAFCGFKNSERFFMDGFGFETEEQIIERLIKDKLK